MRNPAMRAAALRSLLSLLAWLAPLRSARAQSSTASPFDVRWTVDVPVTAASLAIGLIPETFKGELGPPYCEPACDKSKINALDRTVVGNRSKAAATVSDVFLVSNVAMPFALDGLDVLVTGGARRGGVDYLKDATILGEVAGVNFAINNVVKFAVRRPRPLVYDPRVDDETRLQPDATLSFYSGHSSTSFAMATAYSYLFTLRHPRSPLVVPVWLLAEGMATATAGLRVAAGKHFWTDVMTGALVGASIGLLVPILHRPLELPLRGTALAGSTLRVLPAAYPDGGGLSLTLE